MSRSVHSDVTCLLYLPSGVRGDFKQKKEIGQQAVDKSGTGCWSHAFLNQKVRGQASRLAPKTRLDVEQCPYANLGVGVVTVTSKAESGCAA